MENLPNGMSPDKDNVVYYDTELQQFYMVYWADSNDNSNPTRIYIPK